VRAYRPVMTIPEAGRAAGHVLLDAVSSWDGSVPIEQNAAAGNLALERLREIGAVRVNVDDDGAEVRVDVTLDDVVGPAVLLLHGALAMLEERGVDQATALAGLRESWDKTTAD